MIKDPLMHKIYNSSTDRERSVDQGKSNLYEFIICFAVLNLFLANVFAQKTIPLYHENKIVLSGVFFALSFLPLAVLNDVYGFKKSARAIVSILICQFFFISLLWICSLIPNGESLSKNELMHSNSLLISFGDYYKVLIGSMLAVSVSYFFFSILNGYFKVRFCSFPFWIRFILSAGISKLLLVFIAYPINLYGEYNTLSQIMRICIYTWLLKMFLSIFVLILSQVLIPIVRKIENRSHFDISVNFSLINIYSNKKSGYNLFRSEERLKK